MGQRQDKDEIEYGDDCLSVWDPGKTPKYVYIRFSKIQKCPIAQVYPPNDRVFRLEQVGGYPCVYTYTEPDWYVDLDVNALITPTVLTLYHYYSDLHFFKGIGEDKITEGQVFPNEYAACNGTYGGIDGIAVITWRLETLKLIGLLNIEVSNELFMEMRPLDDGSRVYKYCNLKDATNIGIKYDPD